MVNPTQLCRELVSEIAEKCFQISDYRRHYLAQAEHRETKKLEGYVGEYIGFLRTLLPAKDGKVSNREIDELVLQSKIKEKIRRIEEKKMLPSFRVGRKMLSTDRKVAAGVGVNGVCKANGCRDASPVKSNPRSKKGSRKDSKKKHKKIKKRKNKVIKVKKSEEKVFLCVDDCTESHRVQSDNWARCMLTTTKPQILPPVKFLNST